MLAPIVLFTYNRLEHTQRTIDTLVKNSLAINSELFIYSDGYKNEDDKIKVNSLRKYLKTIKGFKKITIIEQKINQGLASSIIKGVTNIINKYGKIIVIEDDIVTSPSFLSFMNNALDYYENIDKVWHISGWNYPLNNINNTIDTFAWRMMNCWGWATWKVKWRAFKKEPPNLIAQYSKYDIYKFDLDGIGGFWSQVLKNNSSEMNTWAIFWYATIFNNNGLCINPIKSFVENIGFDGSGTNTGNRDNYSSNLAISENIKFTDNLKENKVILEDIKKFLIENHNKYSTFNYNILNIINSISSLDKNEKYIIYGAGTICKLILLLPYLKDNIEYIIDKNYNKINQILGKDIFSIDKILENKEMKIIISPIGNEKIIIEDLIKNYGIKKDNLIILDYTF